MDDVCHQHERYIKKNFELARKSLQKEGESFGALLVLNGEIMAHISDKSIAYSDPTAHAELILISKYCRPKNISLHTTGHESRITTKIVILKKIFERAAQR